jgi:hypothetical protein
VRAAYTALPKGLWDSLCSKYTMSIIMSLYLALLFIAFVPGVLVTLPKGGSKMTVIAVHAILFTVAWSFTHKAIWRMSETFQAEPLATEAPTSLSSTILTPARA